LVVCLFQILENFGSAIITNAMSDAWKIIIKDIAVLLADLQAAPTTNDL
jgi:hypothetical protein